MKLLLTLIMAILQKAVLPALKEFSSSYIKTTSLKERYKFFSEVNEAADEETRKKEKEDKVKFLLSELDKTELARDNYARAAQKQKRLLALILVILIGIVVYLFVPRIHIQIGDNSPTYQSPVPQEIHLQNYQSVVPSTDPIFR